MGWVVGDDGEGGGGDGIGRRDVVGWGGTSTERESKSAQQSLNTARASSKRNVRQNMNRL